MPSLLIKKTVRSKMKANGAISGKKTHKKAGKKLSIPINSIICKYFPNQFLILNGKKTIPKKE
jgi:methionine aminopeptidase